MIIEALKQALEALENGKRVRAGEGGTKFQIPLEDAAITALYQAIDEAEKQDVPEPLMKIIREKFTSGNSVAVERITLKRSECDAALAKPEQEPVAWMYEIFGDTVLTSNAKKIDLVLASGKTVTPLYTAP